MVMYACDLETYVSKKPSEQESTWVWSSSGAEINGTDIFLHHDLRETFRYFMNMRKNIKIFYHNLKFDGAFWLDFLLKEMKLEQAYKDEIGWLTNKDMPCNSFKYLISDMGQWYSITIKTFYGKIIEIIDSLKLIPFTLKQAGAAFKTEHQKLEMEYTGYRSKEHIFTDEERKYIINDVLCLKECLEYMFAAGHDKMTIGGNCMEEYKKKFLAPIFYDEIKKFYPDHYQIETPFYITDFENVGEYIRKAYKGGWCYLASEKANKIFTKGATFDVNSLYPSMMHSSSGNFYPIGEPIFWKGNYIPQEAQQERKYYFVRFKCRFYLKENYLPTIQIKNNPLYKSTEYLTTSDVFIKGKYYRYLSKDDQQIPTSVILTLTMTDYKLFLEHYNVTDFEILDGCYYYAMTGLFDEYINHFAEIKKKEKGALRTLAKLFLNNLYGQFAKSTDSSYKKAYLDEDKQIKFETISEFKKTPGYIPIGAAITSYAREFTIRTAQKNYKNFIYADTDSIHMTNPDESVGFKIHDTDFSCWKKECEWETAIFARQKTYIEISNNETEIKCAGMTDKCKEIFLDGLKTGKYCLQDFKVGLEIETGKLRPKRINGGIVLVDTSYKIR